MLDRRTAVTFALCAGLVLGAGGWLAFGRSLSAPPPKLHAVRPARDGAASQRAAADAAALALQRPLFARPDAGPAPLIRLVGISKSAGRASALLTIGAKPAAWIAAGETVDGVTVLAISGAGVSIETRDGPASLKLGQSTQPPPNSGAAPPALDQPPPGMRMPPPPASAPGG